MHEMKPGTGLPSVFYCRPVNDKGGPCHAPDCDHYSGCALQLKRQQHTKDGKAVNHQDHFRCTVTCGFSGEPRHHEEECHIKTCESDKPKPQEAEHQKNETPSRTPKNGEKGGKGGGKGGGKDGTPNHNPQTQSSAPATSPSLTMADPKRRQPGSNASPEESNSKKRRLAWLAKFLLPKEVDVKFPDGEWQGSSEEEDLVFSILVKIWDQVFPAVLDTAQHSP